jgi:hypothetical protein
VPVYVADATGYFSLFIQSHDAIPTGATGTISVLYELSHDNINWSQVTTYSSLLTAFTKTAGPASDGKTFLFFNPPIAVWIRIKVTETGTANTAYVTAVLGST